MGEPRAVGVLTREGTDITDLVNRLAGEFGVPPRVLVLTNMQPSAVVYDIKDRGRGDAKTPSQLRHLNITYSINLTDRTDTLLSQPGVGVCCAADHAFGVQVRRVTHSCKRAVLVHHISTVAGRRGAEQVAKAGVDYSAYLVDTSFIVTDAARRVACVADESTRLQWLSCGQFPGDVVGHASGSTRDSIATASLATEPKPARARTVHFAPEVARILQATSYGVSTLCGAILALVRAPKIGAVLTKLLTTVETYQFYASLFRWQPTRHAYLSRRDVVIAESV